MRSWVCVTSILLATVAASAQAVLYEIDGPTPGVDVRIEALSPDGTAAVGTYDGFLTSRPLVWKLGEGSSDPLGDASNNEQMLDVASGGAHAVGWGNRYGAFRIVNGVPDVLLQTVPAGYWFSVPTSISDDGSAIAGYAVTTDGWGEAFRWTEFSGYQVLFDPNECPRALAMTISGNGGVVAGQCIGSDNGFHWSAEHGFQVLSAGQVLASSYDGRYLVGTSDFPSGQGFRYDRETGTLHVLSAPAAISVSDGGVVITERGSIWDPEHGRRRVEDVLRNQYNIDFTDWTEINPTSISRDGNAIAGEGFKGDQRLGWVVRLQPAPIIAPSDCNADLNASGRIDLSDLALVLAGFGTVGDAAAPADVNNDRAVDLVDLAILLRGFGQDCSE